MIQSILSNATQWWDRLQTVDLLLVQAIFGLVLSVWLIFILLYVINRRIRNQRVLERLGFKQGGVEKGQVLRLWVDGKEAQTVVPGTKRHRSIGEKLAALHRRAGMQIPMISLILFAIGAMALGFLVTAVLSKSLLLAAMATVAIFMILVAWINHRINHQQEIFERQLVDAMGLAARSLRAGHPLIGAFQLIVDEMPAPINRTFSEICQQQALGISLDEAIRNVCAKSDSHDLKMMGTAIIIQMRSGGNLADMMERLTAVIRDRMRLGRRVRVLTAQTQFSKRCLIAMPFVIFAMIYVLNRDYLEPLYTTEAGRYMLSIGCMCVLAGTWIMNKMAVLRY